MYPEISHLDVTIEKYLTIILKYHVRKLNFCILRGTSICIFVIYFLWRSWVLILFSSAYYKRQQMCYTVPQDTCDKIKKTDYYKNDLLSAIEKQYGLGIFVNVANTEQCHYFIDQLAFDVLLKKHTMAWSCKILVKKGKRH